MRSSDGHTPIYLVKIMITQGIPTVIESVEKRTRKEESPTLNMRRVLAREEERRRVPIAKLCQQRGNLFLRIYGENTDDRLRKS